MSSKEPEQDSNQRRRRIIIGLVVAAIVVVIIVGVLLYTRSNGNRLPSSYFNWANIPAEDTPKMLKYNDRVALFHIRSGRYIRSDQAQNLSASATEPASDTWAQFVVKEGLATHPGSVRLQNVAVSKQNAESGFVRFGVDPTKGTIDINAKGSTGKYTPLYVYPPNDEQTENAVTLAEQDKKTVPKFSDKNIPMLLSSPEALKYGLEEYPFLAMNPDGSIVSNLATDATRSSVQSQLLLVRL